MFTTLDLLVRCECSAVVNVRPLVGRTTDLTSAPRDEAHKKTAEHNGSAASGFSRCFVTVLDDRNGLSSWTFRAIAFGVLDGLTFLQ